MSLLVRALVRGLAVTLVTGVPYALLDGASRPAGATVGAGMWILAVAPIASSVWGWRDGRVAAGRPDRTEVGEVPLWPLAAVFFFLGSALLAAARTNRLDGDSLLDGLTSSLVPAIVVAVFGSVAYEVAERVRSRD